MCSCAGVIRASVLVVAAVSLLSLGLVSLGACGAPGAPSPAGSAVDDYVGTSGGAGPSSEPSSAPRPGVDAASPREAGPEGDGGSCDVLASSTQFRCSADGATRAKCIAGAVAVEPCARGCLREAASADDVCMGTSTTWSCPGSYGTTKARDGDYYLTAFGCWKDAQGTSHGDGQDNCVPSCLAQAKSAGLCLPGDTGKQCEERVTWYTADAARFGCLARLKVTNPANGKSVIAVALDFGPSCSAVESKVQKAVLDASGRVDRQLFGSDQGVLDRSRVHVVEVASSTPLGPTSP